MTLGEIHRRAIHLPKRIPRPLYSSTLLRVAKKLASKFMVHGDKVRVEKSLATPHLVYGLEEEGDSPGDPFGRRGARGVVGASAARRRRVTRGEACTRSNKSLSGHLRSRLTEASLIFPAFCSSPFRTIPSSLSSKSSDNRGTRIIIVVVVILLPD